MDKYQRHPMKLLNTILSKDVVPSTNLRVMHVDSGVETSLAPTMLAFDRRSRIYLCLERKRLELVEITYIPKKKWNWPMSFKENRVPSCSII